MDGSADLTRGPARRPVRRSVRRPDRVLVRSGAFGLVCLGLAGCAGGSGVGPARGVLGGGSGDGLPVVVHVVVEASCPRADPDLDELSPLLVGGGRARPVSGCVQDGVDSVFTFDARVPASSTVVVSPADLRGVVVDAARASAAGEVTLRYAPEDGAFQPVATTYGDGEEEPVTSSP